MGKELDQKVSAAKLSLGPFRIKTAFYLNNAGYDSNVYRTPANPIKDFSITTGPGFNIYLPIRKMIVLSIYESPQYVYFAETRRERTWNNYFNGQVHFVFQRFFLTFGKGYSVAREIWNTEIDIRPQRKEDSFEGSVLSQFSKRTSLFFRYSRTKYDYENLSYEQIGIGDRLNRVENRTNFTLYNQLSYRTMCYLNFELGFFNFKNRLANRDSKSYAIYSGFDFSSSGIFRGRINLGYKYLDFLNHEAKDYRGMVGDTNISVRLLEPLSVRANYIRDVEFSVWYNSAYFLENRFGGGVSLYLFKEIRLDYDYNVGRNTYPESSLITQSLSEKRKDNYEIHSAGLYFRLKKNIGLGLTLNKWMRNSNQAWLNGKRTFIGLNLTYDF